MARTASGWSYNAGEKGKNWVRAYEDNRSRTLFVEWREPVLDPATGEPVLDPRTGKPRVRRARLSLSKFGITTRREAREKAKAMAESFAELEEPGEEPDAGPEQPPPSIERLLDLYIKEVTPTKGASKQDHDRRAARIFREFFTGRGDPRRRLDRRAESLDATDWREFITERREGRIPGFGRVRDRVIEYDLKFLIAVLAWGVGAEPDAAHHIAKNPWSRERRKAQKMVMPREKNPRRPSMTPELHEALLDHSPNWRFEGVMEICRETMHRGNSVRQLRWEDIDLRARTVRWRGEFDKNGLEIVAPLTGRAVEVLERLPRVPDSPWVFPAEEDPAEPVTRHTLGTWLRRAKERAGVQVERLGYHGQKRAGVRRKEFRELPNPVREKLTGTSAKTLDSVYDDVSVEEMRDALAALENPASRRGG